MIILNPIGKKGAESDAGSAGAYTKGMLPVRPADAGTTAAFDLGDCTLSGQSQVGNPMATVIVLLNRN